MRSIRDADVQGKRVLLRVDFNVPVTDGAVEDDFRITASIPTITLLRDKGAKVVLLSHRGRPDGPDEALSLRPIARYLAKALDAPVTFFEDFQAAQEGVTSMENGDVALLENLRFERGEEEASEPYARRLAMLGTIYVNDAFAVSHRRHASIFILPHLLDSYAGLLLQEEVLALDTIRTAESRPTVLLLGGGKVESKARVMEGLLERVDAVCVGGITANSILAATGTNVGASIIENGEVADYIRSLELPKDKVFLPVDAIVASSVDDASGARAVAIQDVGENDLILDIGPQTVALFAETIRSAKTIFWNGPMGLFEKDAFAGGTNALIEALTAHDARVVVGGGDVMTAIDKVGARGSIDYASTGGGAMLEYLAQGTLPGIEVLEL
jgi:phosphoglycerate kinase